ncbi:hypothetical protein FM106_11565 [Brachybacterium faecium]|nr:hypothetical protein FM106_11565 [Brachybacterium faecium]
MRQNKPSLKPRKCLGLLHADYKVVLVNSYWASFYKKVR